MAIPYATKRQLDNLKSKTISFEEKNEIKKSIVLSDGKTKVENIYFDTSKSVEEVNEILSKLTYYDILYSAFCTENSKGKLDFQFIKLEGIYGIQIVGNNLKERIPELPESAFIDEGSVFYLYLSKDTGVGFVGWNPIFKEKVLDERIIVNEVSFDEIETMVSENLMKIGSENDKLIDLMYVKTKESINQLKSSDNKVLYPKTKFENITNDDGTSLSFNIDDTNLIKKIDVDWSILTNESTPIPDDLYNELEARKGKCLISTTSDEGLLGFYYSTTNLSNIEFFAITPTKVLRLVIDENKIPHISQQGIAIPMPSYIEDDQLGFYTLKYKVTSPNERGTYTWIKGGM